LNDENLQKLAPSNRVVRQMLLFKNVTLRTDKAGDKLTGTQLMYDIQVSFLALMLQGVLKSTI
jgi:hypothetical protein